MTEAASWQPDPAGRHEYRWWNGHSWTDQVADGGQQAVDPLAAADPASEAITAGMQPASTTVLWEGRRESITAAASGGRMVSARYRITEDAIHFEAGLLSTRAEVIPLWTVMDVDLVQSLTQKARGVGNLIVRLDPQGAKYGQTHVTLESIKEPRAVRDLLTNHANQRRRAMLDHQHDRDIQKRQAGAISLNLGAPGSAQTPPPSDAHSDESSRIQRLMELGERRAAGVLTEDEFQAEKARILNGP